MFLRAQVWIFLPKTISKVSGQVKEDSSISSSLSLAKLARSQSQERGKSLASSGTAGSSRAPGSSSYSSPLDYSRPGSSSSSGKHSSFPGRGNASKRFKGDRGIAPPRFRRGFWKQEPYPCLTLSGGCLSLHWHDWSDRGMDPWVVEVLRVGYRIPFLSIPLLSSEPIPMASYSPSSIKGRALE